MQIKRTIQRFNDTTRWLFEKINKIGKTLDKFTKKERRPKYIELQLRKGTSQQTQMKSIGLF
jgi:hypothetical protein